jgi:hypothetical protein
MKHDDKGPTGDPIAWEADWMPMLPQQALFVVVIVVVARIHRLKYSDW